MTTEHYAPAPEEAAVDIHKPKPIHNVREFLGEILVIVTGVLIALGLEQGVEAWHWHHQVENAQTALGEELSETVGQGRERIVISDCVDRRLDALAALLDQAAVDGKLPPVGDIAMPPTRTWSSGVWASTLAGQTSEHLSTDQRNAFSVIYGFSAMLAATNAHELDIWNRLYTMVGPGRSLPLQEAADLRHAIVEARTANQVMGVLGVRVGQTAEAFHAELAGPLVAQFDRPAASYAICKPMGGVPAHYGNAPLSGGIAYAKAAPITRGTVGIGPAKH